jgi:hypothetical protein
VVRSTGGVTASGVTADPGGFLSRTVTFPTDLSGCVALASPTIDNGSETPIEPMETSIFGRTVTVLQTNSGSGIEIGFAVAVFC